MAKHEFYRNSRGDIDGWRLDEGYHNGPECMRCGGIWCEHCDHGIYDEECPNGQLEMFPLEEVL
jgi:hypothetical protein